MTEPPKVVSWWCIETTENRQYICIIWNHPNEIYSLKQIAFYSRKLKHVCITKENIIAAY
jgi:hypothetical protein